MTVKTVFSIKSSPLGGIWVLWVLWVLWDLWDLFAEAIVVPRSGRAFLAAMSMTNIFLIQLDIVWEDKAANFDRVRSLLAAAPPSPGSLVVLPEMFATGFSMNLNITRQGPDRAEESSSPSLLANTMW